MSEHELSAMTPQSEDSIGVAPEASDAARAALTAEHQRSLLPGWVRTLGRSAFAFAVAAEATLVLSPLDKGAHVWSVGDNIHHLKVLGGCGVALAKTIGRFI